MKKTLTTLLVIVATILVMLPISASPVGAASRHAVAPFRVTSITVSVQPATLSTWKCGDFIQATYHAIFHVSSGPSGGLMQFSTTVNNGRSETPAQLTILPGQVQTEWEWTWEGSLPSDHTAPGLGGVMVMAPSMLVSPLVAPAGACR